MQFHPSLPTVCYTIITLGLEKVLLKNFFIFTQGILRIKTSLLTEAIQKDLELSRAKNQNF